MSPMVAVVDLVLQEGGTRVCHLGERRGVAARQLHQVVAAVQVAAGDRGIEGGHEAVGGLVEAGCCSAWRTPQFRPAGVR